MWAWQTRVDGTLTHTELPLPVPADEEVLVRVLACGVCRTDLHVVDGDLPPHRSPVVPGHEVVGVVEQVGTRVHGRTVGERVGIAWLRSTCGECTWCRRGAENLCPASTYTGWDADGGYADHVTAPAAYVYPLPDLPDVQVAPLLCAGIIGYRALRRAAVPPGGRLGIYGFGASAHITAQIALAQGAELHVLTRDEDARALALELGAASAGAAADAPPVPLDSAIVFAPAGELVPVALSALDRGGTLALAGIHLTDVPSLNYQRHLFRERTLTSVTANTRSDGAELLRLATRLGIRATVTTYRMDQADVALRDLAADRVHGAAVLVAGS
ncbi:zinc-binding alcohol dehydrogenase family protein [Promicromonospora sukumoe]|uniref:Probable alcohol dehydrogenase AdhA n=1 Tax=Promicromonospora sukumoe TaxID=88382 RepID=A0A7W3J7L9_9MICO|nr:zinc-binding alcohol dehydrogenase family protein [Promicromonospora sukumoe]MBA8807782.1 propanol-preferring alcohol dehydrogenase [Promicromonospora sukumoe]